MLFSVRIVTKGEFMKKMFLVLSLFVFTNGIQAQEEEEGCACELHQIYNCPHCHMDEEYYDGSNQNFERDTSWPSRIEDSFFEALTK